MLSITVLLALAAVQCGGSRQATGVNLPWSARIAESFLLRHPGAVTYDSLSPDTKWNYEQGLMLISLLDMWKHSGEQKYFTFVKDNLDRYIRADGAITTYKRTDYNLDNIGPGRAVLTVWRETGEVRFHFAADTLHQQLREQPRIQEGGFWHKKIYPFQMWLDGLFMAQPFVAMYARMFGEPEVFDDIANQFLWVAHHTFDPATGLYYHAWDESKQQPWADPVTGHSPNFWARAMGWYMMAMVDVMEYLPPDHPKRANILAVFKNLAAALFKYRDHQSGLWYQVIDQGTRAGNYLETSASCMFAYAFAKGVNNGYLDREYLDAAERTFEGVLDNQVTINADGTVDLHGTCRGAGLGGTPYRDGSYAYYISEPRRTNDMKGFGPFLRAAIELEKAGRTPNRKQQ